MKSLILRVPVGKVRKHELSSLVNNTIQVVEMHNPAALHLTVQLERLKAVHTELKVLEVRQGALPETGQLRDMRLQLDKVIGSILHQTKAIEKSKLGAFYAESERIVPFIKRYLKNTAKEKSSIVVDLAQRMLLQLSQDSDLMAAVTKVGMKPYLDEMQTLVDGYETGNIKRLETQNARPKAQTAEMKNRVAKALMTLLDAIEVAYDQYDEPGYLPLIAALNKVYTTYKATQKAMATRNRNNEPVGEENETTVASSTKTTATAI